MTVAEADPVLPAASVELKVTSVSPSGNTARPSFVTVDDSSTLSAAEAPDKNAAIAASVASVPSASVAATVIEAGAVMTGAV